MKLAGGDEIRLKLWAKLSGDDYVWHWHTHVASATRPAHTKASFTQSTALGAFPSPASLLSRTVELRDYGAPT